MSRANLALLVVVAGLGGFYYIHDIKGKPEREKAETQSKRFFAQIEKPDVAAVKVERLKPAPGATPYTHDIVMENGVWVLKAPDPVVLKTSMLGGGIKSLVELQRADDLSADGAKPNPADFGLDKPSYRLTLQDKKGKTHSLILGDKTPDEQGYYASLGEGQPIAAVNSTLPELLDPSVDDKRESAPLAFEPSTANKIVVESSAGPSIEVALAKPREDGDDEGASDDGVEITDLNEEWKVVKPEAAAADGQKVRDLLFNWRSVKLGRFMKADEKVDFSKPVVKLTVNVDRQSKPFTLEIGGAVPGKSGLYYARRTPPSEQMVLEIKDFKLLEPKVDSVLQKHIYVLQPEEVDHLVATIEGLKIEGKKSGESWTISQPPKPAGVELSSQQSALADLVWEIKNLEWSSKPDPASVPKDWKERGSIELRSEDKKLIGKISLGTLGPNAQGAYVRDDKGTTYLVEKDPFQRWHDIKLRLEGKAPKTSPTPAAGLPQGFTLPSK